MSNQIRTEVADRIETNRLVDATLQAMNKRHDESEAQLRDLEFEKSVCICRVFEIFFRFFRRQLNESIYCRINIDI